MVIEYANYLAEKGYKITIRYSLINTVFDINTQIELIKIPLPTKIGTIIYSFLKKFQSELIIADIISLTSILSLRNGSHLLYFAQDYDESYYKNPLSKVFIRILYNFCLRFMKVKTITTSYQLAKLLREKYKSDLKVVENGINLNKFYPDPDKDLLMKKEGRKAVVILSRKEYRKGFDIMINVMNKLRENFKDDIEIWTCGEDITNALIIPTIRNFGWVGTDKLRKILSSADALLYPTRHEGFGLFPLEAMACGCPVVTTNVVPYAKDGENALVAEVENENSLKEKLERILSDQQLKDRLKINGLNTVKKYDLNESKRKFEEAIKEIIFPDY